MFWNVFVFDWIQLKISVKSMWFQIRCAILQIYNKRDAFLFMDYSIIFFDFVDILLILFSFIIHWSMNFSKDQLRISLIVLLCLSLFSLSIFVPPSFINAVLLPGFFSFGFLVATLFLRNKFSPLLFGLVFLITSSVFFFEYVVFKDSAISALCD